MAPPRVGLGDVAPDFTLPGTDDREYSLSEYRGQPVVLVFYPGDNTPVCTMQLNTYNSDLSEFEDLGAQILAISPQSVESHERFSNVHGFRFPLLADEGMAVGRAYGILANSHSISSKETMNLLSFMRLGVDLGLFPDVERGLVDALFVVTQPAHLQRQYAEKLGADERDLLRADMLRERLRNVSRPVGAPPGHAIGGKLDKPGDQ